MRWDRWITLLLFRSWCRGDNGRGRILPVLMYHSISADPEPDVAAYYRLCTSPARFARQMEWLREHGFRGVTLSDGLARLQGPGWSDGPGSAEQPVAITFDDGFQDFHTVGFPVLQRVGFRATMYLATAFIGTQRRPFQPRGTSTVPGVFGRPCLTWSEVAELAAAGIEMGSHTVTHPELPRLSWSEIEDELRVSKAEMEQRLGRPVRSFAHPYAIPVERRQYTARLVELLGMAGYETAVTTCIGRVCSATPRLLLPRLPANDCDDGPLLEAKLLGAYDWLGRMQSLVRRWRALTTGRPDKRPPASMSRNPPE